MFARQKGTYMYDHQFTYDESQKSIDEFYELLTELKIEIPDFSTLSKAFISTWDIVKNFENGTAKFGYKDYESYRMFLGLFNTAKWIRRVKDHIEFYKLIPHFKKISNAQFIQNMQASDDDSRKFLEFVIALNLLQFVDEIEVDDPNNSDGDTKIPDIRFCINKKWYAIECKCMSTKNVEGVFKNITRAANQITEFETSKYQIEFGIPLMNLRGEYLIEGLFQELPFANYQVPFSEHRDRLNAVISELVGEQYKEEMRKVEYAKSVRGFGLFTNFVTKVSWGIDKYAVTDIKVCDYFGIDSDERTQMATMIIRELSHQIQLQNSMLYDWKRKAS
jgi:hypothetical protein